MSGSDSASIFSGVTNLASGYSQYQAATLQGKYAMAGAESNARLLDKQAAEVIARGEKDAAQYKKKIKQLQGTQKVNLAAQGIEISGDSALQILEETAVIGAQDALTIKNNAFRQAYGLKSQGVEILAQGRFDKLSAQAQANSSLLTGGLKAFGNFYEAYTPRSGNNSSSYKESNRIGKRYAYDNDRGF